MSLKGCKKLDACLFSRIFIKNHKIPDFFQCTEVLHGFQGWVGTLKSAVAFFTRWSELNIPNLSSPHKRRFNYLVSPYKQTPSKISDGKFWKILVLVFTLSMMKIMIVFFNGLTTFSRHFPEYFPRTWNAEQMNDFSNDISGRVVWYEKKTIKICRVFLFLILHTFKLYRIKTTQFFGTYFHLTAGITQKLHLSNIMLFIISNM